MRSRFVFLVFMFANDNNNNNKTINLKMFTIKSGPLGEEKIIDSDKLKNLQPQGKI